jgi:NAD(P)H-hydrate epimerase
MLSVATTAQIRKLEVDWIAKCNARWGQVLMELAGSQAARAAYEMVSSDSGKAVIICGNGNNGGDGLVIARYLHLWKIPVAAWIINTKGNSVRPEQLMTSEEANANLAIARMFGVPIELLDSAKQLSFGEAGLIVDALLGTGLDRKVEGLYKEVIDCINKSGKPVLAVDIPSGINSDTGQAMGTAIKASETVTFGFLKTGLLCHPGAELCGKLHLVDIGLPQLGERSPKVFLTSVEYVQNCLPKRPADSNKGTYGTLLTIAGSLGMSGATLLSCESSLRVGCGLSLLATPKSLLQALPAQEVIYRPLSETDKMSIHPRAIEELSDELDRASALVLGPGMSTHPETVEFIRLFVSKTLAGRKEIPCIIDADALNAIAKHPDCVSSTRHPFVLTPHPKELSRLIGMQTAEIQADRLNAALKAAQKFASVVLLKGANTIIADPDGNVFINPTGNAGMAKAGAGDVLSGIIGGLLAQGVEPFDAAAAGAYIHGRAGDLASQMHGQPGVLAGDISICIPEALSTIKGGIASALEQEIDETLSAQR